MIGQVKIECTVVCMRCEGRGFYQGRDDEGKRFKQECLRCDGYGILVSWKSSFLRRMPKEPFA